MKTIKVLSLLLMLAMIVSCFVSCKNDSGDVADNPTGGSDIVENVPAEIELTGGYAINTEIGEADLPENVKTAYDSALEGLTGVGYTPVAYLGSQVVAGSNYAILCKATPVVPNAKSTFKIVVVYDAISGDPSILRINDFKLIDYVGYQDDQPIDSADVHRAGGWSVNEEFGEAILSDSAKAACDDVFAGLMGVHYEPIACLATQIVAGTNYAILCKTTIPAADNAVELRIVTIYAALDGSYEVLGTKTLDLAEIAGDQG